MGKKLRPARRKMKPPAKDLYPNGTSIHHYLPDGRLKLHARKLPQYKHSRDYRNQGNAPPLSADNNDNLEYMVASQIQNWYRIKLLLHKRLRQISNKKVASKILARKTTRVLGDLVAKYL
jgi:hypothetical protein